MKKLISIFLCALLAASVVSGCSSNGSGASAGTSKTAKAVKIQYFNVKPEVADVYTTLIKKFESENPGITVEQISVPNPSQVLQTRLASNNMPDVFSHWITDPGFKAMVDAGAVMDLTGQSFLDNVKPDMLSISKLGGKIYALPISMNVAGVFYNTEIFQKYKLSIPKTYSDFIAICDKLKAAGVSPLMMGNKDAGQSGVIAEMLEVMNVPNYKEIITKMEAGSLKAEDVPGFTKMAQKLYNLQKYAEPQSMGVSYDQSIADFSNGKAAMFIEGIWVIPELKKDNPDFKFSTFPLPADTGETLKLAYQNDHCLAISDTTSNKDAALKFLDFMSQKENAQYYADKDGSPSYIKSVQTTITEPQNLVKYFDDASNLALWPDQYWSAGALDSFNQVCQQLISSGDIKTFLKDCDSVWSSK